MDKVNVKVGSSNIIELPRLPKRYVVMKKKLWKQNVMIEEQSRSLKRIK